MGVLEGCSYRQATGAAAPSTDSQPAEVDEAPGKVMRFSVELWYYEPA